MVYITDQNKEVIAKTTWEPLRSYLLEYYNALQVHEVVTACLMATILAMSIYALLRYYKFKSDPLSTFPKKVSKKSIFYRPVFSWKILSFLDQPFIGPELKVYYTNNPCIHADSLANIIVINEKIVENLSEDEIKSIIAHEACHSRFHYSQKIHIIVSKKFERYLLGLALITIVFSIQLILLGQNSEYLYYHLVKLIGSKYGPHYMFRLIADISNNYGLIYASLTIFLVSSSIFIRFSGDYMLWQQEFLADAYSAFYTKPENLISALKNVPRIYIKSSLPRYDTLFFHKFSFISSKFKRIFFIQYPSLKERINFIKLIDRLLLEPLSFRLEKELRKPHSILSAFLSPSLYFGDLPRFVRENIPSKSVEDVYKYLCSSTQFNLAECSKKCNIPMFYVLAIILMLYNSKVLSIGT